MSSGRRLRFQSVHRYLWSEIASKRIRWTMIVRTVGTMAAHIVMVAEGDRAR